nr:hypothetical protein [uncultured Lichenicoccus sp.]
MSRRVHGAGWALLVAGGSLLATAPARAAEAPAGLAAPAGSIGGMAFQYRGDLGGPLNGHLLLALQPPDANGHLQGQVLLLPAAGGAGTSGTVTGSIRSGPLPGGATCTLDVSLRGLRPAGRALVLEGTCSASKLSGSIRTQDPAAGWFARQIFWWPGGDTGGRYWLTRTGSIDRAEPQLGTRSFE